MPAIISGYMHACESLRAVRECQNDLDSDRVDGAIYTSKQVVALVNYYRLLQLCDFIFLRHVTQGMQPLLNIILQPQHSLN